MATNTIIRPATSEEKKDYIELGNPTFDSIVRTKIINEEQIHVKKQEPFCFRCAKLDVQDQVDKIMRENSRLNEYPGSEQQKVDTIQIKEFTKYANINNFDLIDEKEAREDKLLDGIRTNVRVGYNMIYRCKKRGCGITVFVPLAVYEQRKNIKESKDPVEIKK